MTVIKREMTATDTYKGKGYYNCKSQASLNSDGNITLRNYNSGDKNDDEIIILSDSETRAIFELFGKMNDLNLKCNLPY